MYDIHHWVNKLKSKSEKQNIIDEVYKEFLIHKDYGKALVQCCALCTNNQQIGDACQELACRVFGWKDVHSDNTFYGDCLVYNQVIEVKSSCPPNSGFRIGQLQDNPNYWETPLFCQYFDVNGFYGDSLTLYFFWFPTIKGFIDEFNPGFDQGRNGSGVRGFRAVPKKLFKGPFQNYRVTFEEILENRLVTAT
tara:strand:+ start:930 stop:1508 length:579 start_codon:yes stop_codon:yes gene_type:complete